MADPGLVKRMVEDGHEKEAAIAQVDAFTGFILAQLLADKPVRLDGIGILRAPNKAVSAGFPPDHLREQRKVVLRSGSTIEKGDPYPDPRIAPTAPLTAAS